MREIINLLLYFGPIMFLVACACYSNMKWYMSAILLTILWALMCMPPLLGFHVAAAFTPEYGFWKHVIPWITSGLLIIWIPLCVKGILKGKHKK